MLELARLRAPALILGALILALKVFSMIAWSIDPLGPPWPLPYDPTMQMGQYQLVGEKLAAIALRLKREAPPAAGATFGVLIGSSATMHGVTSQILDAEAGTPFPWVNLACKGANIEDDYRVAELIFAGPLKPDTVVLGVHPDNLGRNETFLTGEIKFDGASAWKNIRERGWRGAIDEMDLIFSAIKSRAFPRIPRVNYRVREGAVRFRVAMCLWLGLGIESIFRPASDPFVVDLATARGAVPKDRISKFLDEVNDRFGFFRSESYAPDSSKTMYLHKIIRLVLGNGSRLIVMVTPQGSEMRARVPKEAREIMMTALASYPELRGRVLDLHDAFPDDGFIDGSHVNAESRLAVSRRLAQFIRKVRLDAGTPPSTRPTSGPGAGSDLGREHVD